MHSSLTILLSTLIDGEFLFSLRITVTIDFMFFIASLFLLCCLIVIVKAYGVRLYFYGYEKTKE